MEITLFAQYFYKAEKYRWTKMLNFFVVHSLLKWLSAQHLYFPRLKVNKIMFLSKDVAVAGSNYEVMWCNMGMNGCVSDGGVNK